MLVALGKEIAMQESVRLLSTESLQGVLNAAPICPQINTGQEDRIQGVPHQQLYKCDLQTSESKVSTPLSPPVVFLY